MTKQNIIFVAGMHGNEYLPLLALTTTQEKFIAANPRALARGKRFYQTDMNAAFGSRQRHYEARRAEELLKLIPKSTRVVDFHTSIAANYPFVIIVDPTQLQFALTLGVKRVVYMKHNIKKGHALINYRNGVSVEVGRDHEEVSFDRTLGVVESVKNGKPVKKPELYEVYETIRKPGKYINFKKHPEGFIPVLAGETSYKFYGLKAKRVSAFL